MATVKFNIAEEKEMVEKRTKDVHAPHLRGLLMRKEL